MKYYSQFNQDKYIYETFFKNKTDGFFVDIGASDPFNGSNTMFFEELGWSGILVEPNKKDFDNLIKIRKTPAENLAIYNKSGTYKFLLCGGYIKVLSGLLHEQHPQHLQRIINEFFTYGDSMEIINIQTITLEELLEKYNKTEIDYLSVDTEGSEYSILKNINYNKIKIKCISVENNYNDNKIEDFLKLHNFKKMNRLECDDIYLNTIYDNI
jgi:FkbM family methyltransferase